MYSSSAAKKKKQSRKKTSTVLLGRTWASYLNLPSGNLLSAINLSPHVLLLARMIGSHILSFFLGSVHFKRLGILSPQLSTTFPSYIFPREGQEENFFFFLCYIYFMGWCCGFSRLRPRRVAKGVWKFFLSLVAPVHNLRSVFSFTRHAANGTFVNLQSFQLNAKYQEARKTTGVAKFVKTSFPSPHMWGGNKLGFEPVKRDWHRSRERAKKNERLVCSSLYKLFRKFFVQDRDLPSSVYSPTFTSVTCFFSQGQGAR